MCYATTAQPANPAIVSAGQQLQQYGGTVQGLKQRQLEAVQSGGTVERGTAEEQIAALRLAEAKSKLRGDAPDTALRSTGFTKNPYDFSAQTLAGGGKGRTAEQVREAFSTTYGADALKKYDEATSAYQSGATQSAASLGTYYGYSTMGKPYAQDIILDRDGSIYLTAPQNNAKYIGDHPAYAQTTGTVAPAQSAPSRDPNDRTNNRIQNRLQTAASASGTGR